MYRFLFLLSSIFIFSNLCAFSAPEIIRVAPVQSAYPRYNNPYHNYYNNPNYYTRTHSHPQFRHANGYYPQTNFSDLSALEKYTMNRNYGRESDLQRLQRLEMQTFGALQNGDINTRYENVRNAILARPKDNYKTSLLKNIGNYFNGQMTGFTPPITNDPYYYSNSGFASNPYPTNYGNNNAVQYSGLFGNGGYQINNQSNGSSSSVKILD